MSGNPRNDDDRPIEDRTIPIGMPSGQGQPGQPDAQPTDDGGTCSADDVEGAGPPLPMVPGVTLSRELARGGMGVVYVGCQDFLDRTVAVKLLSIDLQSDQFAARFHREAKLLAGIKHANIVACHDAGVTDEGLYYLVMEYIDGPNLKSWIAQNGPFPVPVALDMCKAAARALDHAHGLGVIHRDVKPENILLETATSTQLNAMTPFIPKLVDLGLARMQTESAELGLTSPGAVMGTPTTMSPEQFDDPDSVDFRTDIYGLGCVLYEMLTGQQAYPSGKLTDLVVKKREPLGPNPCATLDWLSQRVGDLVARMLAADREQRPASYAALIEEIDALATEFTGSVDKPAPDSAGSGAAATGSGPADGGAGPGDPGFDPNVTRGILRSTELNFLAQELGGGGESPAGEPSSPFRDGSESSPFQETPAANAGTGQTVAMAPGQAAPEPASKSGNKTPMLVGLGVVLAGLIGVGIWQATTGADDPGGGDGDRVANRNDNGNDGSDSGNATDPGQASGSTGGQNTSPPQPQPTNRPPTPPEISGADEFALLQPQTLRATASDPDGDELTYEWSSPQNDWTPGKPAVVFTAQGNAATPVMLVEGLPGERFTVQVRVADERGNSVSGTRQITVADYDPKPFLAGAVLDGTAWTIDDASAWTQNIETGAVTCRVRDDARRMSKSLGTDGYWHVIGFLEGTPYRVADTFGNPGVRLEVGDRAWHVQSNRSREAGSETDLWSAELTELERPNADAAWQPAGSPPVRLDWRDDTGECRGALVSLKRRRDSITVQFGCAEHREFRELTIADAVPADTEVRLTLCVDQARGVFKDFSIY